MSHNNFEYTFLKSELTSEIILIIHLQNDWLDKEIDVSVKEDSLDIEVNNQKFTSGVLPIIVSNWLKTHATKVFFANDEGNIVSEAIIGEH